MPIKAPTMLENDMESKRHQKLLKHYKTVLKDEPVFSLKLKKSVLPDDIKPITALVFKPTEDLPFWKLCTIGASDYLMPERDIGCGDFFYGFVWLKGLKIFGNFFLSYGIFGLLFFTLFFTFQSKEKAIVEDILALYGISRML